MDGDLTDFVGAWANALAGTCYVPLTRTERYACLARLAGQLTRALVGMPFNPSAGYEVGLALVDNDFAAPETLGATIEVISDRLLAELGPPGLRLAGPPAHTRLAQLLGALAAGYSWAMRDRTLDEQESIRVAALTARDQAEEALRRTEAQSRHAALHDPLTGLPNRALFTDRLAELFGSAEPDARLGLCFIDLDAFKAVNDSLGHRLGDQLLIAVARRLSDLAAEWKLPVARLGGDEFVLLIERSTGAEEAVKVADQVLAALGEPFHIDGHDLPISASIGIVERPLAGTDPTDVMRAADITLHWAKADGKARYTVFDPDRNAREVARYTLAAAMPAALERGEFTLYYQPIMSVSDRRLIGVEALARWHHPELGLLTPNHFIALAEDSGLIVPLGLRLMEQACQQAAAWLALTPRAPFVSVNLAVRQIRQPGLVADIAAILDRTGLPARKLQLELTESAVMDNDAETLATLNDLANLGVRLAIDDFGTGYSNLAYLRTLPVHELKLAGRFVQVLNAAEAGATTADATDRAILATLVSLGHTIGLTVTAEGVETLTQVDELRGTGCDAAQGWHLGRPGPPEQIPPLLAP